MQSSRLTVSPSPALGTGVVDFSGIWQGQYLITACSGERHCEIRLRTTNAVVLRLTQSGPHITGVLEAWSLVVDVSGDVDKGGTLSLSGARSGIGGNEGIGAATVTATLQRDPQLGVTGDVSYRVEPPPDASDEGF